MHIDGDKFVVGRTWRDPALDAAVDAVRDGYLSAGVVLLRETHGDPELRSLRVDALSAAAVGRSREIAELFEKGADKADVLLWFGGTIIDEAWAIRGGGYASTVTEDRFKMFFATLAGAHDPLMEAARLRPDDPVPWEQLMGFALGMQLSRSDENVIWRELVARCPTLFSGHRARLQTVAAKWGGSHEDMFDHAREAVALAPEGHPLSAMLALAHLEYLLSEQNRFVEQNKMMAYMKLSMTYFSDQIVRELKEAERQWTGSMKPHPRELEAHHLFGGIFVHESSTHTLAAQHLTRVGNRVPKAAPWGYHGDPAEEFAGALTKLKLPLPSSD
ncbi:hypothetical protein [Sinosporangium album]|nr:hypothetical protein [Sinosporangium album]